MINLRDISIRNKLILMQVFTSVMVLSIFFVVFIVSDIRDYKIRKVNSVTSLAYVIGTNSIPTLLFQDNESAKEILSELRNSSPDIIHAAILDKNGKLFTSYTKPGADSVYKPYVLNDNNAEFGDNHLFVTTNIFNNNEIIGKVALEIELSELVAIKKARYEMAIILLLGAVGFSFLIAILVQFYISRRLLYLVNIMKQVNRTGDYNTPPIADEGKDEISILIQVFNNLMQQVKENQTRKDEFIGIASHELKTPLTSVKGYLDLLNKIEDKQPNKQFAQKALENVYKLERLVKDLLDVSKIQSGQLQLNTKEFNIDELIGETIASIQIVSATHKINRENTSGDLVISADRQRIEQVLLNLLSNAIKYSPGETEVMISSEKTGSDLIIRVRDFGIGIPKEELPEIFERFYRTKDISVYISGFGLGLYICRNIILRHNGKIWAERENKGSSFYFSLPL